MANYIVDKSKVCGPAGALAEAINPPWILVDFTTFTSTNAEVCFSFTYTLYCAEGWWCAPPPIWILYVEAHSQQHETVEDDLFFFSFFFKENIQVMDQMLGLVTFAQRCILC